MSPNVTLLFDPEVYKVLLTLFLSFLIGIKWEELKVSAKTSFFGGVGTFPFIGLLGYAIALVSRDGSFEILGGFAVMGALMFANYRSRISSSPQAIGIIYEVSALSTYLLGAIIHHGYFWIGTTLVVISLLLLEIKGWLELLSKKIGSEEIFSFTKFLLITAVILPVVPNASYTQFDFNPFKTWLAVVGVSSVSYITYLLEKITKKRGSLILSAILGGAYSSTVTTIALAKQSKETVSDSRLYAGSILMASGTMYIRLGILVAVFNLELIKILWVPFLVLAFTGLLGGWLCALPSKKANKDLEEKKTERNPLELQSAFIFALLFTLMTLLTKIVTTYSGVKGIFVLAGLMGVTDVDPFILNLTQSPQLSLGLTVIASSIIIAAASNNIIKGTYAYLFGSKKTGLLSFFLLLGLALLGIVPLFFF